MQSDLTDLLRAFNDGGVNYLVVGGHAVMLDSEPRFDLHDAGLLES